MKLILFLLIIIAVITYILKLQCIKYNIKYNFIKKIKKINQMKVDKNIIQQRLQGIPIYYINLNKAIARRKSIEKFIRTNNIPNVQRVEAIYGKELNTYNLNVHNEYTSVSPSELGCFLSHVIAVRKAYDNGDKYALILEDDVYLNMIKIWETTLQEVIDNAPSNWKIIQLYETCSGIKDIFYTNIKKKYIYIPRDKYTYIGCVAYIIKRNAMESFLKHVNYLNGDTIRISKINSLFPIDFYLYNLFHKQVYMTKSLFIPNNTVLKSQQQNHIMFLELFFRSRDEKAITTSDNILKKYNI